MRGAGGVSVYETGEWQRGRDDNLRMISHNARPQEPNQLNSRTVPTYNVIVFRTTSKSPSFLEKAEH